MRIEEADFVATWAAVITWVPRRSLKTGEEIKPFPCSFQVLLVNLCEGTFLKSVSIWALCRLANCPTRLTHTPLTPI